MRIEEFEIESRVRERDVSHRRFRSCDFVKQ